MSNKASYTAVEWELVAGLAPMVAAAASIADGVTVIGTVREMDAGIRAMQAGITEYADNELITAILTEMVEVDEAATGESAEPHLDAAAMPAEVAVSSASVVDATATVAAPGVDANDPEAFIHETVANAMQVREILAAKSSPEEAEAYKAWVMHVLDVVINRSKSGGFLGIGGTRVGESEAKFKVDIAAALGV